MDADDVPSSIRKDDIQGDKGIEHPEVEDLGLLEQEEHPPILWENGPLHQAAGTGLRRLRHLGADSQEHGPRPRTHGLDPRAGEIARRPACHAEAE
jgi:hypothetical protein